MLMYPYIYVPWSLNQTPVLLSSPSVFVLLQARMGCQNRAFFEAAAAQRSGVMQGAAPSAWITLMYALAHGGYVSSAVMDDAAKALLKPGALQQVCRHGRYRLLLVCSYNTSQLSIAKLKMQVA